MTEPPSRCEAAIDIPVSTNPGASFVTEPDRAAARVVRAHSEQGWSLLCTGVVLFDDGGCLVPDCRAESPPPPERRISSSPMTRAPGPTRWARR
jgi:hypothetical protein